MSSASSLNLPTVMDAHRPAWTLGRRGVLPELSPERAWRWCVLRTLLDAKQAKRKGRPIAAHHLARLFARRWHQMSDQLGEFDREQYLRTLRLGRYLLGKIASERLHFLRKGQI